MTDIADGMAQTVPAAIDYEMGLIREAIAMVASGGAPRVVLGGIRFGETLTDWARELATDAGVTLRPIWRSDEDGADLSVERAMP